VAVGYIYGRAETRVGALVVINRVRDRFEMEVLIPGGEVKLELLPTVVSQGFIRSSGLAFRVP